MSDQTNTGKRRVPRRKHLAILRDHIREARREIYDNPPADVGLVEWQFGGGAKKAFARALYFVTKNGL